MRRALALGAVSVGLGVAVAIGVALPGGPAVRYANAAVSIEKATDYFSVTITDPAADPRRFEEAFRAVGLNVTVKVIPVAPGDVGRLIGPIVPATAFAGREASVCRAWRRARRRSAARCGCPPTTRAG